MSMETGIATDAPRIHIPSCDSVNSSTFVPVNPPTLHATTVILRLMVCYVRPLTATSTDHSATAMFSFAGGLIGCLVLAGVLGSCTMLENHDIDKKIKIKIKTLCMHE